MSGSAKPAGPPSKGLLSKTPGIYLLPPPRQPNTHNPPPSPCVPTLDLWEYHWGPDHMTEAVLFHSSYLLSDSDLQVEVPSTCELVSFVSRHVFALKTCREKSRLVWFVAKLNVLLRSFTLATVARR